ncbi:hypothetical protein Dform_00916 [Dehalogenimonas formicexedens]|uniref:DUF3786 domain-containing protein n=1 Tax=Dehalogenimonas formicexedens TaxID=1839801 RepID=A0A1P8F718_9CHLR|nr:DUF3786 domain-containing protein [Dehalogenimonas formicexedens]APV44230.1 hypothetical protein Dform_00889 [Dehalogenimonas formicexedens]APV44257.1 hypothetical protein Dform_00916 [Dehalogenimonas formicexedens]
MKPNEQKPKLPSPPGYDQAYGQSYELAFDRLTEVDPTILGMRSGASLGPGQGIKLDFLNFPVIVDIRQRSVTAAGFPLLSISDKLVILHYLVTAGGKPASGKLISFKDLPEGSGYFPTFYKRAIAPIVNIFNKSVGDLIGAAKNIGGTQIAMGDLGLSIPVFARVTLNWVFWRGDDLLPPEGSILFDASITDYLPVEDVAVLCHSVANRLAA